LKCSLILFSICSFLGSSAYAANFCGSLFGAKFPLKLVVDNTTNRDWKMSKQAEQLREADYEMRLDSVAPVFWVVRHHPELEKKLQKWIKIDEVYRILMSLSEVASEVHFVVEAKIWEMIESGVAKETLSDSEQNPQLSSLTSFNAENVVSLFSNKQSVSESNGTNGRTTTLKPEPLFESLLLEAVKELERQVERIDEDLNFEKQALKGDLELTEKNSLNFFLIANFIYNWHPMMKFLEEYVVGKNNVFSLQLFKDPEAYERVSPFEEKISERELSFYLFLYNRRDDPRLDELFDLNMEFFSDELRSPKEVERILDEARDYMQTETGYDLQSLPVFLEGLTKVEFRRVN